MGAAMPDAGTGSDPDRFGPDGIELVDGIEAALAGFLEARSQEAAAIDPEFAVAVHALTGFVLGGGKRIRPTFAWWGWRGAGGALDAPDALSVLRAVSALELIQACALVHDDLMDASATRRGRPTVHVDFARRHADAGWRGSPAGFGASAAILGVEQVIQDHTRGLLFVGEQPPALVQVVNRFLFSQHGLIGAEHLFLSGRDFADGNLNFRADV